MYTNRQHDPAIIRTPIYMYVNKSSIGTLLYRVFEDSQPAHLLCNRHLNTENTQPLTSHTVTVLYQCSGTYTPVVSVN